MPFCMFFRFFCSLPLGLMVWRLALAICCLAAIVYTSKTNVPLLMVELVAYPCRQNGNRPYRKRSTAVAAGRRPGSKSTDRIGFPELPW